MEKDIKSCVKIDDNILSFFKNKRNFKAIADLKNFSNHKLEHTLNETKRANIEIELSKTSISKNLNIDKLKELLGNIIEIPKKKIKIEDQTVKWLTLTPGQLKEELNDLKKYPNVQSLKRAGYSLLNTNEKKSNSRDKIMNVFLKKIPEEKARVHFGR